MKLLIVSDIHGDAQSTKEFLCVAQRECVDKIIILGDILYHGPRNDLPENYAPKEVIRLLNENSEKLLCVKGNCEAEVDGMVLDFPVDCESAWIYDGEHKINMYLSHGHKHSPDSLPSLPDGSIFLYGHTHIYKIQRTKNILCINPGSVSLPKCGNPKTYAIYDSGIFKICDFDGKMVESIKV